MPMTSACRLNMPTKWPFHRYISMTSMRSHPPEHPQERRMPVEHFSPTFLASRTPMRSSSRRYSRPCPLAPRPASTTTLWISHIGLGEDQLHQLLRVSTGRQLPPATFQRRIEKLSNGPDAAGRPARGLLDGRQHVEQPTFPVLRLCHGSQSAVVFLLRGDDGAAQVEHGDVEQAGLHERQDVEDATGAAVAIGKRMDRLELVVRHGHPDQRVEIAGLAQEVNQVLQQATIRLRPRGGV